MEAVRSTRLVIWLAALLLIPAYAGLSWWKGYNKASRAELKIGGTFDSHTERRVREYVLSNLLEGNPTERRKAELVWRDEFLVIQTLTPPLVWLWGMIIRSIGALPFAFLLIRIVQGTRGPKLVNTLLLGLLIGLGLRVGGTTKQAAYEKEYNRRALSTPIPREEMIRICRWHRTSWDIIQHQVPVSHREVIGSETRWQAAYRAAKKEGPLDPDRALFTLTVLLTTVVLLIWLRRKWKERKHAGQ